MMIPENSKKKLHSNVIIRKKLKSNAKIGALLFELVNEKIWMIEKKNETYSEKLKRFWLHKYTFSDNFGEICVRKEWKIEIEIEPSMIDAILTWKRFFDYYSEMGRVEKKAIECTILHLMR